jgi:hypothetical protein
MPVTVEVIRKIGGARRRGASRALSRASAPRGAKTQQGGCQDRKLARAEASGIVRPPICRRLDHDVAVLKTTYLSALVKGRTDRVGKGFSDEWGQRSLGDQRRRLCWVPLARQAHRLEIRRPLRRQFPTGSRANINNLLAHLRFESLRRNVTFPPSVEVDEISNPACPASPVYYRHDPAQTARRAYLVD